MKKQGLGPFAIALIVIAAIVILGGFWWMGTYNSLVAASEGVTASWAQVETQYQRRVDLIPNLVATVKGAAGFESSTLEEITALRSQWQAATTTDQKVAIANSIEGTLSRLMVVVENYPQLKATQNFLALQDELSNTENKVAVERGRFNEVVRAYNTKVKTFPTNIVAGASGFAAKEYFQSSTGAENAPQVKF
jgi:LemA protein